MKTKTYILLQLFLLPCLLFSQLLELSIEECQEKARENYPLIKQYELISLAEDYTLDNLTKNYLPQISLGGQASYQTQVITIPIKFPGSNIPKMDKDQYKVTLDVTQLLWDGGFTRSQKKITKANSDFEKQKLEVNLYTVRDKINQLYFGILTIDKQLTQLDVLTSDLYTNYDLVNSMLKNGVAMVSDLDLVKVELLNTDQKKIELNTLRLAYIKMLSLFINEEISQKVLLKLPDDRINYGEKITRPEINMYDKQNLLYEAKESTIKAKNKPKFSLFAQGEFGKPGLNMLSSDFKTSAIGGVRLSWDFGNLYTKKNEYRLIRNDIKSLESQRETFLFNTNVQLTQIQNEINKYQKLMTKDEEIIQLRNSVKKAGESKYKNGIYKMNDLIGDINAENQARLTQSLHEMQYLQSIYNYKYVQGN
jgi:outer membrane protein TolC